MPYPKSLSGREKEVYLGIAQGLPPIEIAHQLGINVKTVATYRARILEKTGLRSNAGIAVDAERRGLLKEVEDEHSDPGENGTTESGPGGDPASSEGSVGVGTQFPDRSVE